jgi:hypothetical protein
MKEKIQKIYMRTKIETLLRVTTSSPVIVNLGFGATYCPHL